MSSTDKAYKEAFIKYVNVILPQYMKLLEEQNRAMNLLARNIRLMPNSVKVRYW